MFHWLRTPGRKALAGALSALLLTGAVLVASPGTAQAHCDNVNGPVVTAARQALETGNVNLVLPYVKADAEAELKAAFDRARSVRRAGGEAQTLADTYFFETAVRLHRAGEGAGFTGLKYEDDYGPALHAAEEALVSGSLREVSDVLSDTVREGLDERYHAVVEARKAAAEEKTVEADRERVEAELGFELYVYGVYQAALGAGGHEGGQEAGGHEHGAAATAEGARGEAAVEVRLWRDGRELATLKALDGSDGLMLPLRAAVEAAGGQVEWLQQSRTAVVTLGGRRVVLRVGSTQAEVDGKALTLPLAPQFHGETTVVPAHVLEHLLEIRAVRAG
ncbi:MAG: DUF6448 family protein [Bacillota bacterium]